MKLRIYHFVVLFFIFSSCSDDDDFLDINAQFYSNAFTATKASDIVGTWAIFQAEFDGNISQIPINYQECGRDYLVFEENGIYKEYLFQNSDCDFFFQTLNWSLKEGIITLSNQQNQSDEIVITKVNNSEMVFKSRLDVDGDGELDIFTAYLKPFVPIEFDRISNTFSRDTSVEKQNLISYNWQSYQGSEAFVSYEIYRNTGSSCSKNNAELIETITDVNTTSFTDLTPPVADNICYFLKVNIASKVLGESDVQSIQTYTLEAAPVNLATPEIVDNTIRLSWDESKMPYFSHYEIYYGNYPTNITGYGKQEISVTKIYDKSVTSFTHQDLPYLENPHYKINVYDIFGNKTFDNPDGFKTSWEVNYTRKEVIELQKVNSYAIHPNKPLLYFFGYKDDNSGPPRIFKYNYETNSIENISSTLNVSTTIPIKFFITEKGEEIFRNNGNEIKVFDANTLEFKYDLKPTETTYVNDFWYTDSGYWLFTDGDHIASYSLNGNSLEFVNKKLHFAQHQGSFFYSILEIKNNQFLVGHRNEGASVLYNLDENGLLERRNSIPLSTNKDAQNTIDYSTTSDYIIKYEENKLFDTDTFSEIFSIQNPNFTSGISLNGQEIYGSDNDPEKAMNNDSDHKKEAIIYNRQTQQVEIIATKGYPKLIFQNYQGKIISISSGIKKENIFQNINDKADLFIEIIKE